MHNQISTILSFKIGGNVFALDALHVLHILEVPDIITRIPNTSDFMKGVINHHGNIIPVADMRIIMEEEVKEKNKEQAIIIVNPENSNEVRFGIYVDMISEVIEIKPEDLKETVMDSKRGMIDTYVGTIFHKGTFIHIIDIMHLSEIIDK
ncbi:MAG: chemotaxis protein CheW [Marinilabiliaceae bacterium]|nr:chemotaxis protein CheW [Marinilabiliaceae bacterium]